MMEGFLRKSWTDTPICRSGLHVHHWSGSYSRTPITLRGKDVYLSRMPSEPHAPETRYKLVINCTTTTNGFPAAGKPRKTSAMDGALRSTILSPTSKLSHFSTDWRKPTSNSRVGNPDNCICRSP